VLLIADDRVVLKRVENALRVSAPQSIRGKLEVRGLGIVAVPAADWAEARLVVDLVDRGQIDRLPDPPPTVAIAGIELPVLRLAAFEDSAAAKLIFALALAGKAQLRS
jgi:serine kinase of HPr protein (carbohydrate metabolism regulator)